MLREPYNLSILDGKCSLDIRDKNAHMPSRLLFCAALVALSCSSRSVCAEGPSAALREAIAAGAQRIEGRMIGWRRDIHAHPELGNRERRTSALVADHLSKLGLEVRTGVARTGVVAILKGGAGKGRVVALRADMDALPVKEATGLPFASHDKGEYRGTQVDVMHACGHDGHTAILMAVAELLSSVRAQLPGTVVFYFQPAEEGPSDFVPDGKNVWGAKMMIQEGAMKSPRPDAIFGLHLWAALPRGRIGYRSGATMASSDDLRVRIIGRQTHAGRPWSGVDPIVVSAQAILGLQTIISRQTDISEAPTVLSVGTIHGGTRYNIIPDAVELEGTLRSYDQNIRRATQQRVRRTLEQIAASAEAKAEVTIVEKYDPTINDAALTERSLPSLRWAAHGDVVAASREGGAEDFSFYAKETPGFFFFLGASPPKQDPEKTAPNHSPNFIVDEAALQIGVRALAALATDFLVGFAEQSTRP